MAKTGKPVTLRWHAIAALVAIIAIQLWVASYAADSRSKGAESDNDYWLRVMRSGRADGQRGTKPGLEETSPISKPEGAEKKKRRSSRSSSGRNGKRRRVKYTDAAEKWTKEFDRQTKGTPEQPSKVKPAELPVEVPAVQEPTTTTSTPTETVPKEVPTEAAAFYDALTQMLSKMGFNDGGAVPVGESVGPSQIPYPQSPYTVSSAQNYYYPVQQVQYGAEVPEDQQTWSNLMNFFGAPVGQNAEQVAASEEPEVSARDVVPEFSARDVVPEVSEGGESTGASVSEENATSAAEPAYMSQFQKAGDTKQLPIFWYRRVTPVKTTHGVYYYPRYYPRYYYPRYYYPRYYPTTLPAQLPVYPSYHVQPAPCFGTHCKETQSVHNLVVLPMTVEKPEEPKPEEPEPEVPDEEVGISSIPTSEPETKPEPEIKPEPEKVEPTAFVHVHVRPMPKVRTVGMALRRRREDLSLAFHHGTVTPSTAMWSILKVVVNFKEVFPLSFYKELSDGTSVWILKVTRLCDGLQIGKEDAKRAGLFLALYYWRFLAKPVGDGEVKRARVVLIVQFDADVSSTCSCLLNSFLEGLLVSPNEAAFQSFRSASTPEELSSLVENCTKGVDCDRSAMLKSPVSDVFVIAPPSGDVSLATSFMNAPMLSNSKLWTTKNSSPDDDEKNLLVSIVGDNNSDPTEAKSALPECYGGTNTLALTDAPCEKQLLSLIYKLVGNQLPVGDSSQDVGPGMFPVNGNGAYPAYPSMEEWFKTGNAVTYPFPAPPAGGEGTSEIQNGVGMESEKGAGKLI